MTPRQLRRDGHRGRPCRACRRRHALLARGPFPSSRGLGVELHRSNREGVVLDYARDASEAALGGVVEGDGVECRVDGDELILFGEARAAVHVDTVDCALVAVDKQHRVGVLFSHGTDHIAGGRRGDAWGAGNSIALASSPDLQGAERYDSFVSYGVSVTARPGCDLATLGATLQARCVPPIRRPRQFEWRNAVNSPHDQPHRKYPQMVEDREEEALTALTSQKA